MMEAFQALERDHVGSGRLGYVRFLALEAGGALRAAAQLRLRGYRRVAVDSPTGGDSKGPGSMPGILLGDIRYAVRTLLKQPGFTLVVVATLALGIGANTAVFSIVNSMLFRPFPVEDPEQLVQVLRTRDGSGFGSFSYPDYADYRDRNEVFSDLFGQSPTLTVSLRTDEAAQQINALVVTPNYFSALGVTLILGRGFLPEEERTTEAGAVVVISHGLWNRHFGAEPDVLGKTLVINGNAFTVVGVGPEHFTGTLLSWSADVWIPTANYAAVIPWLARRGDMFAQREMSWLVLTGRLDPAAGLERARAEMTALAQQLEEAYPDTNEGTGVAIYPKIGQDPRVWDMLRGIATTMMSVVGLVLLIVCANVANMMLARASARRHETALRLAIGSSRWRVIRQALIESLLLAAVGGAAGLLVAYWGTDLLLVTAGLPPGLDPSLDWRVFGFALLVSMLAGTLFGAVPAFLTAKPDLVRALKDLPMASGRLSSRLRDAFVVFQVAASLVLLVGAGLFVRSLQHLQGKGLEVAGEDVLLVRTGRPMEGEWPRSGFYAELVERLEQTPGVEGVSLALSIPAARRDRLLQTIPLVEGSEAPTDGDGLVVPTNLTGPNHLTTLGIPVVRGRQFDNRDMEVGAAAVIVNETLARLLWPNEDPIGKRLDVQPAGEFARRLPRRTGEVIGVAKDALVSLYEEASGPYLYLPLRWYDLRLLAVPTLHLRALADPADLVPTVLGELAAVDRDVPIAEIMTVEEWVASTLQDTRAYATLIGIAGLLAAVLAALGVHGVMAHAVTRRRHEIGLRIALGARSSDVVGLILGKAIAMALLGSGIGLLAAWGVSRIVASQIYGVAATDPLTFAAAPIFLGFVALLASFPPAQRATRVDPLVSLCAE